jgi:protein-S-isoprenylcysteine O-methyltransferase Ste14
MSYVIDVLIIVLLFLVYSVVHSYLASFEVKASIKKNFGSLMAFYRLAYNIFAIISLYIIYEVSPKPHLIIYDLPKPFDIIILVPQSLALIGIFWAFKYICAKEFLGLNQVKRYFNKNYNSEFDEELTLTFSGPYKYTRHPVYLFSILFLAFRPAMDLFYLTFFLLAVVYFYIGSVYEEKKMTVHFGNDYIKYQKAVRRIFPAIPFKPYVPEEFVQA